jgi:uncharacterized protein
MGGEAVAADDAVLVVLAKAGRLPLLGAVFGDVAVEAAVERECLRGLPARPDARAIEAALATGALRRAKAEARLVRALAKRHPALGAGEVGAIALGRGGVVLLDDGLARRVARLEGATPVGTLGVLARAHLRGALKARADVAAALRDVLQAGLWVDAGIVETFWAGLGLEG